MINSIDISQFQEESYMLTEDIEILISEEGIFILSPDGLFEISDFEKNVQKIEDSYILYNNDKDKLTFSEKQYQIVKKLFEEKMKK